MLTIDFEKFDKNGMKKLLTMFGKTLPIEDVQADNKQKREAGYAIKQATITFDSGQVLVLKIKAEGSLYQAKLNGKILAIKDYIKPDSFMKEVIAFVKDNEPRYLKQQERAEQKKKIRVPIIKPVNTTVEEQTHQAQDKLDTLRAQIAAARTETEALSKAVSEKQTVFNGLNQQIDAANALSDELRKKLEDAKQGIFESAKRPLKKGDIVKFAKVVDKGDEKIRMRLLEDPDGGRVRVEALMGMNINPTYVYPVKDLVLESGQGIFEGAGGIMEAATAKNTLPQFLSWESKKSPEQYSTDLTSGISFAIDRLDMPNLKGYSLKVRGMSADKGKWQWVEVSGKISDTSTARLFSRPKEAYDVAKNVYREHIDNKEAK